MIRETTDTSTSNLGASLRRLPRIVLSAGLALAGAAQLAGMSAAAVPHRSTPPWKARHTVRPELTFEPNHGQADADVKFLARGVGYTAFLGSAEAILMLRDDRSRRATLRLKPVGANPASHLVGDGRLPGVVNYGQPDRTDPSITVPTYRGVRYVNVYPGIDLAYHGDPERLEYDFVVAPGADPERIALAFDGVDRVEVDAAGTLVAHTGAGELRQPPPVVYQEIDGTRRHVDGAYVVDDAGHVRFRLGTYDHSRPLVIDPVLAYSTYLGGTADDSEVLYTGGAKIAVDPAGNFYVAGATPSLDFPTTPGPGASSQGRMDAFVTKFSPAGDVVYSTYLGTGCDDVARDIAVDAAGNAYITGRAWGGANCYAGVEAGVLVAKLDPTGALLWASKFGGRLADSSVGTGIAVDAAGHAYVTGVANSDTQDFPTTPGSWGTTQCANVYSFAGDAFVAKLSADGNTLLYSKILCGQGDDSPRAIAVDAAGVAYITGSTGSSDFPTVNPIQATRRNGSVAVTGFVAAIAADASHVVYSTYLGGSDNDFPGDIAVDDDGSVYVTGETASDDFPTTPGVVQAHPGTRHCLSTCSDAFVTKIAPNGTAIVWSTYLAGNLDDAGMGIAVDAAQNAYVVGTTTSSLFPVVAAFQPVARTIAEAFVTKLSADATRIVYSSYLGGSHTGTGLRNGWDAGWGIALDGSGNAYLSGYTESYDFPTVNAFQPQINDGGIYDYYGSVQGDVFVSKVTAGGPGIPPPVKVTVTPAEAAPGATVTATWAGNPTPAADDSLQLYELGAPFGDPDDMLAWAWTNGAAAGTLPFPLPVDLAAGWYELRLVGKPPSTGVAAVMGRSEPFRVAGTPVTTTTTSAAPSTTTRPTTTTTSTRPTTTTTVRPTTTTTTTRPTSTTTTRPTTTTIRSTTTTTSTSSSTAHPTTSSTTTTTHAPTTTTRPTTTTSSSTSSTSTTRPTTPSTSSSTSTSSSPSSTTTRPAITSTTTTLDAPTTTTLPATSCDPSECDDGDPCTVDGCLAGHGCASKPASGFASVVCTCMRATPAVCAADALPPSIDNRRNQACGHFATAAAATDRASALRDLKRAVKDLKVSMRIVTKARRHGVSDDCITAFRAELRDAKDRAQRLAAAMSGA
jgi:hypothetical protein